MAAGDPAAKRPALSDEVGLTDELVERAWPHPRSERLALGRRLEQGFRSGTHGTSGGGHGRSMVARRRVWLAGRGDVPRSADQKGPIPVISTTTHNPIRKAIDDPPITTMRRRSRET